MKRAYVYKGYLGNYYITDKPIEDMGVAAGPMTVPDAEAWVDKEGFCIQLDRDLIDESGYDWENEDYESHTFDYEEEFGKHDFAIDCNGWMIREDDTVLWTDPEFGYKTDFVVFGEPNSEMVKLWSNHGECEALPCECEIIEKD